MGVSMKNQALCIERFSSVSSLVVTSELQFLRLNPERSNLRLCGVLESPKSPLNTSKVAKMIENSHVWHVDSWGRVWRVV